LAATLELISDGRLSLDGLITHEAEAEGAAGAYRTAFSDAACLKMILDWRGCA
jgi:3-hydroxyethyl bacteriochlorophyllide a dehydrogenase